MFGANLREPVKDVCDVRWPKRRFSGLYLNVNVGRGRAQFDVFISFDLDVSDRVPWCQEEAANTIEVLVKETSVSALYTTELGWIKNGRVRGRRHYVAPSLVFDRT